MKIMRWCVIMVVLWSGFAFAASAQQIETVRIPLMRLDTGDIGCGDELVWVQRQVEVPDAAILAALRELLDLNPAVLEEEGLHNALLGRPLWIEEVWVSMGTADMRLGGSLGTFDECEAYRIDAQLRQVALQFDFVNEVNIWVAGQPLQPVLDEPVPPVTPPAPPAPPDEATPYTVVRTDTLSSIARRHGTTVRAIQDANPQIVNPNLIFVGQQIWIPEPTVAPPVDPPPPPTPTPPVTPPDEPVQTARVPLMRLGTGDIGCDDELVWVERQVQVPDHIILESLRELLRLNPAVLEKDLHNALFGRAVWIEEVWVSQGTADMRLGGSLGTFDECEAYRIDAQLRQVALQFDFVNEVNIWVGGQPLPQVLGVGN